MAPLLINETSPFCGAWKTVWRLMKAQTLPEVPLLLRDTKDAVVFCGEQTIQQPSNQLPGKQVNKLDVSAQRLNNS